MATESISARFTMELEFVLCLANPNYLMHLAHHYPHLLVPPEASASSSSSSSSTATTSETDAIRFARYLQYLYDYWRKPDYVQYLTHPATTLRNLELLQQEQFRKDLVNPAMRMDIINRLALFDPPPTQALNGADEADDGPGTERAAVPPEASTVTA